MTEDFRKAKVDTRQKIRVTDSLTQIQMQQDYNNDNLTTKIFSNEFVKKIQNDQARKR